MLMQRTFFNNSFGKNIHYRVSVIYKDDRSESFDREYVEQAKLIYDDKNNPSTTRHVKLMEIHSDGTMVVLRENMVLN